MPTTQATDYLALKARVDTLVTLPVLPVFEPGALVTAPGLSPFLMLGDVVNEPDRVGINTDLPHTRSGTFLLSIQWPIAAAVTHTQIRELQGVVAAHFSADTCCRYGASSLRVTRDADCIQPYVDGAYRVAVVRVFWSSI